jgi:hypothetical protein
MKPTILFLFVSCPWHYVASPWSWGGTRSMARRWGSVVRYAKSDVRYVAGPERRMRQRSVARMIDSRRKREIEDAMKTLFTGCAQCGALTTDAEGYCPDCEAARLARRGKGRMGQTRILAPNVRNSSNDRR